MKVAKPPSMTALIQGAKESAREIINQRIVRPRSTVQIIFFIMAQVVLIVLVLWGGWWLPKVDVESARWALSAQAQASGAILGLLIAAMVFRWRIITNQEQELRNKIHLYFKQLADPSAGVRQNRFIVDVAYDEYLSWINQEKGKVQKKTKAALITLGRFWVIKRFSLSYSWTVDMALGRNLRHGEMRDLSRVSKLSRNSAIDMWDSYFTSPARFVLHMHDALQYVSRMLAIHRTYGKQAIEERYIPWSPVEEYRILETVVGLMRKDDTWLIASETARGRSAFRLPFYISCGLLSTATILALTILTGLGGIESLLGQQPDMLRYLVGVPIGLSIYGIYFCVLLVIAILR